MYLPGYWIGPVKVDKEMSKMNYVKFFTMEEVIFINQHIYVVYLQLIKPIPKKLNLGCLYPCHRVSSC